MSASFGARAVALGHLGIADRPLDRDVRVVPGDTGLGLRVVVAREQIAHVGDVREDAEAVAEAGGDEELAVVGVAELVALPSLVGGGVPAQVDGDVPDRPAHAAHELRLARAGLEVDAAEDALVSSASGCAERTRRPRRPRATRRSLKLSSRKPRSSPWASTSRRTSPSISVSMRCGTARDATTRGQKGRRRNRTRSHRWRRSRSRSGCDCPAPPVKRPVAKCDPAVGPASTIVCMALTAEARGVGAAVRAVAVERPAGVVPLDPQGRGDVPSCYADGTARRAANSCLLRSDTAAVSELGGRRQASARNRRAPRRRPGASRRASSPLTSGLFTWPLTMCLDLTLLASMAHATPPPMAANAANVDITLA